MEWAVLVTCALVAAALVARPWPRSGRGRGAGTLPEADLAAAEHASLAALVDERRLLLAELSELDEDAAAGRIAADDRQAGRRALAPRLRAVSEALRAAGVGPRERDS
jgi:hypothetical protein